MIRYSAPSSNISPKTGYNRGALFSKESKPMSIVGTTSVPTKASPNFTCNLKILGEVKMC